MEMKMLRMIKKYLPAFGTLFAITFFLVMALTALAHVEHAQQEKQGQQGQKQSRSTIGATRPRGSVSERQPVVGQEGRTLSEEVVGLRTEMIEPISNQGQTRTDRQESEPYRLF
jgi:cell division protein FtsI/penicillin-binding protein 2